MCHRKKNYTDLELKPQSTKNCRPVATQLHEQNENIEYLSKVLKSQNFSWIIWIIQQLVFKPTVSQSAVGRITRGDGQVKEEVIYSSSSVKSLLQLQTDI